ncbi:BON1-associated protein 2-like [Gastrolobium bilobum]|uniref:BON1-associated protein 2-like n=1 Tax=Gastrolobium bilobum TaxID=150636 RepID=UPI002AB211E7|nr:BON1-associated protein 2-like [Gastrolobium bilobum]
MDTTHQRRTLELTVLSAENLRVDGKPATKNLYVVVRAESITSYTTSMAAGGDGGGGCGVMYNPSWNEKLLVDMAMHARSITLEVKCKSSTSVKDVGVARIAVSDFLGGVVPDHCLQFLSYRLRDWEGSCNGVLNFSVRVVKSPEYVPSPVAAKPEKVGPCGFQMRDSIGERSPSLVVIGIPVQWINYGGSSV